MKSILAILMVFTLFGCANNTKQIDAVVTENSSVKLIEQFDDLAPLFYNDSDTTYLVNFWATTCPPCIKEMPLLMEVEEKNKDQKIKVLLVSLDFAKDIEKRVVPFVEKHKITPQVLLLGDQNYSAWTEKIDSSWYGALPATLIVNGKERNFSFGAFETYEEIDEKIQKIQK